MSLSMTIENLNPRHVAYRTFVGEKNKFIFTELPKAACSTTKFFLYNIEGVEVQGKPSIHARNLGIKSLCDFSPQEVTDMLLSRTYFKFCIVRNPYSRLFSAFSDKIEKERPKYDAHRIAIREERQLSQDELIDFNDFVYWMSNLGVSKQLRLLKRNAHWGSMSDHLFYETIPYDRCFKFEELPQNLVDLERALGFEIGVIQSFFDGTK